MTSLQVVWPGPSGDDGRQPALNTLLLLWLLARLAAE